MEDNHTTPPNTVMACVLFENGKCWLDDAGGMLSSVDARGWAYSTVEKLPVPASIAVAVQVVSSISNMRATPSDCQLASKLTLRQGGELVVGDEQLHEGLQLCKAVRKGHQLIGLPKRWQRNGRMMV